MLHRLPLLILFCAFISSTAQASPTAIHNPSEPPSSETWSLQEIWRLDNEEDDTLPLMGIINQAAVTSDNHVLLVDFQMAHVLEIAPGGEVLGTLSRYGQGPGELEQPNTIFLTDEGQVGLIQVYPGKVILINRDDTPGRLISFQGDIPMVQYGASSRGDLIFTGQISSIESAGSGYATRFFLARYSQEGVLLHTYLENTTTTQYDPPVINEKGQWFPHQGWAVAGDGSLLVAPARDEYRIEWREPNGDIRRVMTRDFKSHVRTDEERKERLDAMRMYRSGGELKPKKTILDTEPAIEQIQVLNDGSIWVRSCWSERDLPEGVHCRFDVFDSEGRFESEVSIAMAVDREKDYFRLLKDGRFLWSRNGRSAVDALYSHIEGGNEEEDEEEDDGGIQVILLERAETE